MRLERLSDEESLIPHLHSTPQHDAPSDTAHARGEVDDVHRLIEPVGDGKLPSQLTPR